LHNIYIKYGGQGDDSKLFGITDSGNADCTG